MERWNMENWRQSPQQQVFEDGLSSVPCDFSVLLGGLTLGLLQIAMTLGCWVKPDSKARGQLSPSGISNFCVWLKSTIWRLKTGPISPIVDDPFPIESAIIGLIPHFQSACAFPHTKTHPNIKRPSDPVTPPHASSTSGRPPWARKAMSSMCTNSLYTPSFGENTICGGHRLTLAVSLVQLGCKLRLEFVKRLQVKIV